MHTVTIPAIVPVPAVPALRSPTPAQAAEEEDFAEAMHRAVHAVVGGTVGSPGAPAAAPVQAQSASGEGSGMNDVPLLPDNIPTGADATIEPQPETSHETETTTRAPTSGRGPREEPGPLVPRPVRPESPPVASSPPVADTATEGGNGTGTPDRAPPMVGPRFTGLPPAGPAPERPPGPFGPPWEHALAPAAVEQTPRVVEHLPPSRRTGPGAGPQPDAPIRAEPGRPVILTRATRELTEPARRIREFAASASLPLENGTTEGSEASLSPEEGAAPLGGESVPHSSDPAVRSGEAAGMVLPPSFRETVSGPTSPGKPLRDGKHMMPPVRPDANRLLQLGREPATLIRSAPATEEQGLAVDALPGSRPPHPGSGGDQALRIPEAKPEGRTRSTEFTLRDTPHLNLRPVADLGLSSARAVVTAWWEGSSSPRGGGMTPAASARPRTSSPLVASAMGAGAEFSASPDAPQGVTEPPGPIEHSPGSGVPLPSLAAAHLDGGPSDASLFPGLRPGAPNPDASPRQASPGDQMALTLRQDDGTAVTIRVLVRGDRVEATIIDRGPPQVPVGTRETTALHQALERQGFRDVQVMVQHVIPGDRPPYGLAPESRRTTDSPQDRPQHSRRQDDEGSPSQGRSHQRSPRERER